MAPFKSCPGVFPEGMVLDETDTCIKVSEVMKGMEYIPTPTTTPPPCLSEVVKSWHRQG